MKKKLTIIFTVMMTMILFTSCSMFKSNVQEMEGSIKGCTYNCMFFDNHGQLFMTAKGENINLSANIVREQTYSSEGGWGYTNTLSSVVTITIDGNQMESCGSTMIFAEDTLSPDVEFEPITHIESKSSGSLTDWTSIAAVINKYKNAFGKGQIVVIQSQLGDPICAYSGNSVYWQVCSDLPKTTKLMIDGQALYIHRANFQIIDKDLLN